MLLFAPACDDSLKGFDGGDAASREDRGGEAGGGEATSPEATSPEVLERTGSAKAVNAAARAPEGPFVHRATDENSRGDYTYLSDPRIDGDPNAVVLVAPDMDAGGGSYDHNVGVWYEPEARKWAIFNQDRAAVPAGAAFRVTVPREPDRFVHHSTPENTSGDSTFLDHPLVNGKPEVALTVTQNWNPGGGRGVYNNHPVGVRYDAGRKRWAIHNKDGSEIPDGAAFNVSALEGVQMVSGDAGTDEVPKPTEQAGKYSEGFPEYRDFYSEGDPKTPKLVSSGSSVGAIPVVKPFNFGRDPGGPEDKTLYITIPKIGLEDTPVFDTVSEEKLRDGTVHIPATGYPWQEGANVFIAGHRIGYEGTPSYYVFFRLDELVEGDEILLEDSAGKQYLYRVTQRKIVGPDSVEVMNAVEGESLVTLQTCTLPDYKKRLIVQGELVEKGA